MHKIFFIPLFLCCVSVMYAEQIEVCPTCEITTIKEAISKALDGDEIIIRGGVYKEHNIEIKNKSIIIRGIDNPVIDGENKATIFKVNSDNFSIEGLTIINVGQSYTKDFAAILINRSNHFTIKNNILKNVFFGILVEKSHFGIITGNQVSSFAMEQAGSGNGIHLWHSSNMKIGNNTLHGLRDGIYFEFVKTVRFSTTIVMKIYAMACTLCFQITMTTTIMFLLIMVQV